MTPFRAWRAAKLFMLTSGLGASAYYIHCNDDSLQNIGAIRFARAGLAASFVFADYKWSLLGMGVDSPGYAEKMRGCHRRGAERLLQLAQSNGGVFIKVGQHIASLQYLLPDEYCSTLSVLHSKAAESNLEDVKRVFVESTGRRIEECFSEFNPIPCGSASLAQVHEAILRSNGERVAVKIQHPKVKARSHVDIATMELFLRIAAFLFPSFKLLWLVEETRKNLPKELDFRQEAANADRARLMFSHLPFLRIPTIHYGYSTDMVLTMEMCEGGQVKDLEYYKANGLDKHRVCKKIGRLYSEMIHVKGYVHCDPHSGNVLVRKGKGGDEEVVLLDHGLYLELPDSLRVDYSQLWLALLKPDKDEIQRICTKMGIGEYYGLFACIVTLRSWESVTKGITRRVEMDQEEQQHIRHFAATLIPQISDLLSKMPRPLLLILKTNDLIRSIQKTLGVENRENSFIEMTRCCTRSVYTGAIAQSGSYFRSLVLYFRMYTLLVTLYLYERYLIVNDLLVGAFNK